jgi:hypothetical protein
MYKEPNLWGSFEENDQTKAHGGQWQLAQFHDG